MDLIILLFVLILAVVIAIAVIAFLQYRKLSAILKFGILVILTIGATSCQDDFFDDPGPDIVLDPEAPGPIIIPDIGPKMVDIEEDVIVTLSIWGTQGNSDFNQTAWDAEVEAALNLTWL